MHVRPADPDDAPAIESIARAAWWEAYPGILDTDDIDETLDAVYDPEFLRDAMTDHDDLLYLVAETDDGVVGFASAQQTWADEVEIHTLYVEPDHWGEGVGSALLASITDSAESAGVDRLRVGVLSGNHVGRAFFESNGFERVETRTAAFGEREVPEDVFEKPL
ncbi:GNAT family N-acetyltransferase [Halorarius litoreus]|uniref:GNAT family N-acetyltransferase n=1 Tax=Halorarius litoreus TaxID=2962676 RepID=UPI0020CDC617|nr:GNAT family N-acetyltransferase [Halorarius litoreus]